MCVRACVHVYTIGCVQMNAYRLLRRKQVFLSGNDLLHEKFRQHLENELPRVFFESYLLLSQNIRDILDFLFFPTNNNREQ